MIGNNSNESILKFLSFWKAKLRGILKDGIYVNSIWLIANSFTMSVLGFLFWIINARLFSSEQLGLASALISAVELLMPLSLLGFNMALIRYLPSSTQKQDIIDSCFSLSGLFALITSSSFVLSVKFFLPKLELIWNYFWGSIFVIFVISYLFFELQTSVLIAQKRAKYSFFKTLIYSICKLIFPFILLFLGALGIFSSWIIGLFLSIIAGTIFIKTIPKFKIKIEIIKKLFSFSAVNYISTFLSLAPGSIIPLLITSKLYTSATAYFYISWNITLLLFIVPHSVSQILLAEDPNLLKTNVIKSIKLIALILIPAVIITIAISEYLLLIFGAEYSQNASRLLQLLAFSSIPFAFNRVYIAVQNVKHNLHVVLIVHLSLTISTLGLSYILLTKGIIYVGIARLICQTIVACVLIVKIVVTKNG